MLNLSFVTSFPKNVPRESKWQWFSVMAAILVVASMLRGFALGRSAYWYDEVVTIRMATAPNLAAMFVLLEQTDATRAILHPFLLHGWVKVFGPSEVGARAFSVICGILTVAWIGRLGRILSGDRRTGLWAAFLAAISPALIGFSREVRMYALLGLLTCIAWDTLIALRKGPTILRLILYALALTALVYAHPLGLLMVVAIVLASLPVRRELGLSWSRWLIPYLMASLAVGLWIGRYLDHQPEYVVGHKPWSHVFRLSLGFLGGNLVTVPLFLCLIVLGLLPSPLGMWRQQRISIENKFSAVCLLSWLLIPTGLLIVYSALFHSIFGPPRYSFYVAPAYILLVARGLGKLPRWLAAGCGLGITALCVTAWPALIYKPDLKLDWRMAALELDRRDPSGRDPVGVLPWYTRYNYEVHTARFYLSPHRKAYPLPGPRGKSLPSPTNRAWLAIEFHDGQMKGKIPHFFRVLREHEPIFVPGLCLIAVEPDPAPQTRRLLPGP